MNWQQVVEDPHLQNLPYKIETNEWGQIVMTPARLKHGSYQFRIGNMLSRLLQESGEIITEAAIRTRKGSKVADVAWFDEERWSIVSEEFDASISANICVEVISPGNSTEEIDEKKELYFEAGAEEVWTCDSSGAMSYFAPTGELPHSTLVPDFPANILH